MEEEFKITNDIMFQSIFGKVGNERITKGFLEKVLGIQIEELTLDANKRMIGELPEDKIGRIDIKARLSEGTKVIIEMQVARYKYMSKRLLYYWSKAYAEDLKRGDEYQRLDKTIAILISVEDLKETKGIEEYHTIWEIRERKYLERKLTEDLEIHILELNKFKEGREERPEDNWIRFLRARRKEEVEKLSRFEKEIEEARKELEYITSTPELRELYEQREKALRDKISFALAEKEEALEEMERIRKEGIEKGIKEGIKEGREAGIKEGIREGRKEGREEGRIEGIKEKQKEIIVNLYKMKMHINDICKAVGLNEEEVKSIVEEE